MKNFKDFMENKIVAEKSQNDFFENEDSINEVKFSEKNLKKVVNLYSSLMGKQMKGKFYPIGLEDFKRKTGPGKGFRVMNDAGEQLRFNWDQKRSKKAQFDLTSIDYWKEGNINFQKPTRTVMFAPDLNVVQVLSKVVDALVVGHINEARFYIEEANKFLFEKKTGKEKGEWMASHGLTKYGTSDRMRKLVSKKRPDLVEELEIFLGEEEKNTFEAPVKEMEKMLDKTVYANPETVFEDIEDLLSLVATGKWRTLIVCGQGGIGKTFHITEGDRSLPKLLGPEGDKWTYHSGTKAAPYALYKTLFQERQKIIVFDEADSLLKNKDIQMMLKPILDTSGGNMAEYMSGTQNMVGMSEDQIREYCDFVDSEIADGKLIGPGKKDIKAPSKFYFEGAMIFISNMKASEIEGAIMSRSIFVDVYLAEQDILKRIKTIAMAQAKNDPDTTDEDVEAIMESLGGHSQAPTQEITYMTPEYARKSKQITVRAYSLANTMRKSGLKRWAELAALYA